MSADTLGGEPPRFERDSRAGRPRVRHGACHLCVAGVAWWLAGCARSVDGSFGRLPPPARDAAFEAGADANRPRRPPAPCRDVPAVTVSAWPAARFDGTIVPGAFCSSGRICWEHPLPQGNALNAAWAAPDGTVWAVGNSSTVLHLDAGVWTRVPTGTRPLYLRAVGGTSADDVWIVGTDGQGGTVSLHWDGSALATIPVDVPPGLSLDLSTVYAARRNDVWAAGGHPSLMHWDGVRWSDALPGVVAPARQLLGFGPDAIWRVTELNGVSRWDGAAWSPVTELGAGIRWMWGPHERDLFALGSGGLRHSDGTGWREVAVPIDPPWDVSAVAASPGGVGWVADQTRDGARITRWDGTRWEAPEAIDATMVTSIVALDETHAWAVGDMGRLLRWDGARWALLTHAGAIARTGMNALAGSGADDVWAAGVEFEHAPDDHGVLHHWDGAVWSPVALDPATPPLTGVWVAARDDAWAVGGRGTVLHWDGTRWGHVDAGTGRTDVLAVWGSGPHDVWISLAGLLDGGPRLARWNGAVWSTSGARVAGAPRTTAPVVMRVAGSASDDVWLAGYDAAPFVLHWDGASWRSVGLPAGTGDPPAVWVGGPDDAWIADRAAAYWDGDTMTEHPLPRAVRITALWGSCRDDVWAAGDAGQLFHWDGARWQDIPSGAESVGTPLWAAWGADPRDVWFAGGGASILRFRP